MREITLDPGELGRFSVPQPVCLMGERQYALGLGSIVAAISLRVGAEVTETEDDFEIRIGAEAPDAAAKDLLGRWRQALAELAVHDPDDLAGLRIELELGQIAQCCALEVLLHAPAVAVALVCALTAHRGSAGVVPVEQIVGLAGDLLAEVAGPRRLHPDRFYAECSVCVRGGALYVSPGSEPLNVQLLMPPDSLILVVPPARELAPEPTDWERLLLSGLGKAQGAAELIAAAEDDLSKLFEAAAGTLDDRETGLLYGLLRVQEMIRERIEEAGEAFLDHDRVAEICDEESAILHDYLGFPAEPFTTIRNQAVQHGALGAKLTYAFGGLPAVIVLAPGRREEAHRALARRFANHCVVPVDVDPDGLRGEW